MAVVVDIEGELIPRAQARWPHAVVRDELDNNLLDELPTIQFLQIPGGGYDGAKLARMLVEMNVYAGTRVSAFQLARDVHDWMMHTVRSSTTETLVVGLVRCLALPAGLPYENKALRRVGGTYEINCHPA
ncbi:phage tail termination protein [Streptomyces sp. ECR3.8]|uniref:phage tail termination protein n=1 Tax=Streptomyces sp. ECR3.8 TaxID=3461009 RepID=UPI004041A76D